MNKNIIKTLLGKSFPITGNIGNIIEKMLGAEITPHFTADLGIWEIKSRMVDAKAFITLGGKKGDDDNALLEQVFAKIQNVIFVEYFVAGKSFHITGVTILFGLDKSDFFSEFGKTVKMERRSDGQRTLKISRRNFIRLYRGRAEYSA